VSTPYATAPTCVRGCGRPRRARKLCAACYSLLRRTGDLYDYPASVRRAVDVAEDWEFLRRVGVSRKDAAARMGMTDIAFERALYRARVYERRAECSPSAGLPATRT